MTEQRQSKRPSTFHGLFAVAAAAVLLSIYLYQLDFTPPRWEEPRRCIVAFEMIERGDYVVPTVYREIYSKKPPLQNWLIAAGAGFQTERVAVLIPRLLSVFSVFLTALILTWLAWGQGLKTPAMVGVVFLTLGIEIQYGRSGAIDPLFVLWTTAALASFYWGIERNRPVVAWVLPQLFVGLGVLTKGLAPVFVYPAIVAFILVERRSSRRVTLRLGHLVAGAIVLLAVVGIWLVPLARSGALAALGATSADEVLSRTPAGNNAIDFVRGLVRFPIEVLVNLLPWTLFAFALFFRQVRAAVATSWSSNRLFRFCAITFACMTFILWFMPDALGRYAMPAYPFFAIAFFILVSDSTTTHRRISWRWSSVWVGLGMIWLVLAGYRGGLQNDLPVLLPSLICVTAVALAIVSDRALPVSWPIRVVAFLGFLYSAFFATIHGPSRATWHRERVAAVSVMADVLEADAERRGLDVRTVPIGCSPGVNQAVCFEIMKHFNRSVTRPKRNEGASYGIGHVARSEFPNGRETLVTNRFKLELWYRTGESQ